MAELITRTAHNGFGAVRPASFGSTTLQGSMRRSLVACLKFNAAFIMWSRQSRSQASVTSGPAPVSALMVDCCLIPDTPVPMVLSAVYLTLKHFEVHL